MIIIKNNKGLTLVEILITIAVLGIVIIPLMSMFITSQKMNNESEMKYRAIQFAQEELETIKAMEQLDTDDDGYPPRGDGSYGYETSPDSEGYTIDVKIEKGVEYAGSDIEPTGIPENYDRPIYNITDEVEFVIDIAPGIEKIAIKINIPYVATARIKLNNSNEDVKVYLFNENNQLYDIAVTVKRNDNLIDIIMGTTVFEINPD